MGGEKHWYAERIRLAIAFLFKLLYLVAIYFYSLFLGLEVELYYIFVVLSGYLLTINTLFDLVGCFCSRTLFLRICFVV